MERKHHLRRFWKRKGLKENLTSPTHLEPTETTARRPKSAGFLSLQASTEGGEATLRPQTSHGMVQKEGSVPNLNGQVLHLNTVDLNLADEFRHMTFGGDDKLDTQPSQKRHSEDVADRNAGITRPDDRLPTVGRSVDILDHNLPGYPRTVAEKSRYSEEIANRNLSVTTGSNASHKSSDRGVQSTSQLQPNLGSASIGYLGSENTRHLGNVAAQPELTKNFASPREGSETRGAKTLLADIGPKSSTSHADGPGTHSLRRKASLSSLKNGQAITLGNKAETHDSARSLLQPSDSSARNPIPPTSVPAPQVMPSIPRRAVAHTVPQQRHTSRPASTNSKATDTKTEEELNTVGINLDDTTDTHVRTKYAPAVTHETVEPTVRHIREEQITREIHNHDVFHRILPIRDVEVLPSRHFVRASNGDLEEIPAAAVPGATGSHQSWKIVSTGTRSKEAPLAPRTFTASTLDGLPQDFEERLDPDGVKRSHTNWIHRPVLADGARRTGQTKPFYVDV
jgi:hypothetical protein